MIDYQIRIGFRHRSSFSFDDQKVYANTMGVVYALWPSQKVGAGRRRAFFSIVGETFSTFKTHIRTYCTCTVILIRLRAAETFLLRRKNLPNNYCCLPKYFMLFINRNRPLIFGTKNTFRRNVVNCDIVRMCQQ